MKYFRYALKTNQLLWRPAYFNHEKELDKGPFYTLDQILTLNYSETIKKRLQKSKPGTFIKIMSSLWSGSGEYGLVCVNQADVIQYYNYQNHIRNLTQILNDTGHPRKIREYQKLLANLDTKMLGE